MIHPDIELVHHRAGADGVGRLRAAGCAVEHEGGVLVDEHGHRQVVVIADAVLRAQDAQPLRRPAQLLDHAAQMLAPRLGRHVDDRAEKVQPAGINIVHERELVEEDRLKKLRAAEKQLQLLPQLGVPGQKPLPQRLRQEKRLHMPQQASAVRLGEVIEEILLAAKLLQVRCLRERSRM